MNEERAKLLRQKAAANLCRREREYILSSLPAELSAPLAEVPFITPPEADQIVHELLPTADGLGYPAHSRPTGYDFRELSSREEVLNVVQSFPSDYDKYAAVFSPTQRCPFFRVSFGWARQRFSDFFARHPYWFYLATEDQSVGIVLDHYSGYLRGKYSEDEIVYELGLWHPNCKA
ncbi:hypothetical protein ACXR0O_22965 [Verrucomicrobiota bacterium sgz303538]